MNQKIYVMLSMTGTRISHFLRGMTRKKYTHVSIALDPALSELYSFGRRNFYFPLIGGFVQESLTEGVFGSFDTSCLIYEIPVTDEAYFTIKTEIESFIRLYDRYRYNFSGLLFMYFDVPFRRRWHFVCSQFVAYLLEKSNVATFPKDYSLVRPEDFSALLGSRKIFEGSLRNYSPVS